MTRRILSLTLGTLVAGSLLVSESRGQQQIQLPLVFDGSCPVAAWETATGNPGASPDEVFATKGVFEFTMVYDNLVFRFANWENMEKFRRDPVKYTPALGGFCVTCLKDSSTWVLSRKELFVFHDQRFFLFPNEEKQKLFMSDPSPYANFDLANQGQCRVAELDAGKNVPGNPEYRHMFAKRVYQFLNEENRKAFERNPSKYRVPESSGN